MWEIWIAAGATALYFVQMEILRRASAAHGLAWSSFARTASFGAVLFLGVFMAGLFGPIGAGALGLACNVFIGGRAYQVLRRSQRVRGLLERVRGPEADAALALLEREVEGLRGGRGGEKADYDHRARWVLSIAASVSRAGHPQRALDWTMRVEHGVLGRPLAAIHAQHEAVFRIAIGDREGARRAIARASRPAIAPWEDALLALEALLDALEGNPEAVLSRTSGPLEAEGAITSRVVWQAARAHAQAKLGAIEEARSTLRTIRSESGDEVIHRVAMQNGPASRLAEALLAEGGAYR
jgi:hypothetical protein